MSGGGGMAVGCTRAHTAVFGCREWLVSTCMQLAWGSDMSLWGWVRKRVTSGGAAHVPEGHGSIKCTPTRLLLS